MDLEEPSFEFVPDRDERPKMPEPLPVKLVAVADVRLPGGEGLHADLDAFYVDFLGFERQSAGPDPLAYRAENFMLSFDIGVPVDRETYRALQIEVPSLAAAEAGLVEREWDYTRARGLTPGTDVLVLRDPAGNWVELLEVRSF